MSNSSNSVSYTERSSLRRTGSKRDSDRGRTVLNSVNQEVGRSDDFQQEIERRSSNLLVSPLSRQVSALQLRSGYQPQSPVTLQRRGSGRENRRTSWHQRQEGERVEYTAWQNQGGNGQGYYSARGVSASSSRGQFVYFNCFTTGPLSLHLNSRGAVSMDVPNGYLNSHRGYAGNANQGLGNDFNQRQTVHHRQGGNGVPGSAQTVNHGTNFFNFYFVNAGAYDLNFAGSGFQGLGGQASEPNQVPQHSNQAHTRAPTGMYNTGAQFPSTSGPVHSAPNPGLYAAAGPSINSTSAPPVPLHPQPTYANAGTSITPGRSFQPYGFGGGSGIQHGPSHMGPMESHNHSRMDPHFGHYRQPEQGFRSYSQSSLENLEDVFDEEDPSCSQCSQKSLPRAGGHNHFHGFQR